MCLIARRTNCTHSGLNVYSRIIWHVIMKKNLYHLLKVNFSHVLSEALETALKYQSFFRKYLSLRQSFKYLFTLRVSVYLRIKLNLIMNCISSLSSARVYLNYKSLKQSFGLRGNCWKTADIFQYNISCEICSRKSFVGTTKYKIMTLHLYFLFGIFFHFDRTQLISCYNTNQPQQYQ